MDDCEWLKGVGVMEEFDVNVIVIPDCRFFFFFLKVVVDLCTDFLMLSPVQIRISSPPGRRSVFS